MKLLCYSPKAYEEVKENIAPLPSRAALSREFAAFSVQPGIIAPALEYLKQKVPTMTKPGEKLATIIFDEMKIEERACRDKKMDAVLGPDKQAQQIMVRSIGGDWKVPIQTEFDKPVTKEILFELNFIKITGFNLLRPKSYFAKRIIRKH